MGHRFLWFVLTVFLALPAGAQGQDDRERTLADIRQELSVLYVELQRLNRELSTTGGAAGASGAGSLLDRLNAIEGEVQRLTALTEKLDFRITSIVRDGTNRLGDLEFRLCELEAKCDVSRLSEGTTLGGVEIVPDGGNVGQVAQQPDIQMAVGEESDFARAEEALAAADYATAAQMFETFRQTYPGGPLSARAGLLLGDAREGTGDLSGAARAYLDVFSAAPDGPEAPDALYNLGRALGALGQTNEACVTLGEVEVRFPAADVVLDARATMRNLGCS